MKQLYIRNCPVCQSKIEGDPIVMPDTDPTFEKTIKKKMWKILLKKIIFFPYYRCKCGMLTTKTYINEKILKHLYSDMQDNVYKDDGKNYRMISNSSLSFSSGYGDGGYSVYGYINDDDRIIKVEIIMGEHIIDMKTGNTITDHDETKEVTDEDVREIILKQIEKDHKNK